MPLYEFKCNDCNQTDVFHRPMKEAADPHKCTKCNKDMDRVYSQQRAKEFFSYYDEQYKCEIHSKAQEKRLMKKNGHVDARETPSRKKYEAQIKEARKKAKGTVYFQT